MLRRQDVDGDGDGVKSGTLNGSLFHTDFAHQYETLFFSWGCLVGDISKVTIVFNYFSRIKYFLVRSDGVK